MKQTPVKIRRAFDETFKREAVQNWLARGKSAAVTAQELGLSANRLYAWKKLFAPDAADPAGGRVPERASSRPIAGDDVVKVGRDGFEQQRNKETKDGH